jgi:O-acetyl-ADP-ribose deacetylase (regulator of RNase III)
VIHTVGPVWDGGEANEDLLLASCYRNSLALAAKHGVRSIAFPAISTGIFGFPPDRAASIAVRTVRDTLPDLPSIERVVFCCFGSELRRHHEAALVAASGGEAT